MDIDKLERANILAKSLIPKVDELLNMSSKSNNSRLADAIWGLSECDEVFETKFKQFLKRRRKFTVESKYSSKVLQKSI